MKETDWDFGITDVQCDNCNRDTYVDSPYYSVVNEELRADGWITTCIDDEFLDFCCEECYSKYVFEEEE